MIAPFWTGATYYHLEVESANNATLLRMGVRISNFTL